MRRIYSLLCLVITCPGLCGQSVTEGSGEEGLERRLGSLSELDLDAGLDFEDYVSRLKQFAENPVELDASCEDKLRELGLLTELQIGHLMRHIKANGPIKDIEELQLVSGFDSVVINRIKGFVKAAPGRFIESGRTDESGKHSIILRSQRILQKSKAYSDENRIYKGSPYHHYTRYQYNYKQKIEAGFTLEKDAGERIDAGSTRPFDYQSFYLSLSRYKSIERIIVGDFKASFGQGLTFSSFSQQGKSAEALFIQKNFSGISPYKSVNEFYFLRGMAASIKIKQATMTYFFSGRSLPANVTGSGDHTWLTSFYTSGLHRTENEMAKRDIARSETAGINLLFEAGEVQSGIIIVNNSLNVRLSGNTELYEMHRRSSVRLTNGGYYFRINKGNYSFFGEVSVSLPGDIAMLSGLLIMPDSRITLAILGRNYGRRYAAISSSAFGEKEGSSNEKGLYLASRMKLSESSTLSAFCDFFTFPWPTYYSSAPSAGAEYFAEFSHSPEKGRELNLRARLREKERDLPSESPLAEMDDEKRSGLRIQYLFMAAKSVRMRSRIEFSEYLFGKISDHGYLAFQEIKFQKQGWRLSVSLCYTVFDTDSYQSRIYAYEQDVSTAYSVPAFYGNGSKTILLIQYRMNAHARISARLAHLMYSDRSSIGSGADEITGPLATEVKIQLQLYF